MAMLMLRLPEVKPTLASQLPCCRFCGWKLLQRRSVLPKAVRDPRIHQVAVHCYRCCRCQRTWQLYPDGVDQANQKRRLVHLAAITWALGLSLRWVVAVFAAFGLELSCMTVLRDGQALGHPACSARGSACSDSTGRAVAYRGSQRGIVVAVDLGAGVPVAVAELDEKDPVVVTAWHGQLVEYLGVKVIVTDNPGSYRRWPKHWAYTTRCACGGGSGGR